VAIDGSLIIRNAAGRRPCEAELTKVYQSRHAGCHSSNLRLYPDAHSVRLSTRLERVGYRHLGDPRAGRFQLEVYPHPALIEIFGLDVRLRYKKGRVAEKREGQARLAALLADLARSTILTLDVPDRLAGRLDAGRIVRLKGAALKHNEDALDAVVCLYVCALYAIGARYRRFGDLDSGYIVVPGERCR
jgi:predicted RNase H-like nuclease